MGYSRTDAPFDQPSCCSLGEQRDALQPTAVASEIVQPAPRPSRIVRLCGGRFRMGTDTSPLPHDGESPARLVKIKPFAIDPYAVTNDWFRDFVAATGYRTDARALRMVPGVRRLRAGGTAATGRLTAVVVAARRGAW